MHSFAFCAYLFKHFLMRSCFDKPFKMGLTSSMMAAGRLCVCRCLKFLLSLLSCTDTRSQGRSCDLIVHQLSLCEKNVAQITCLIAFRSPLLSLTAFPWYCCIDFTWSSVSLPRPLIIFPSASCPFPHCALKFLILNPVRFCT